MKKLFIFLFVFIFVFSFSSCSSDSSENVSSSASSEYFETENEDPEFFDSIAELSAAVGFTVPEPVELKSMGTQSYQTLNKIATIIYEKDEDTVARFNISKDSEADLTCGYIGEATQAVTGSVSAELRGDGGSFCLALWSKDGYYFSIVLETPVSSSVMEKYIKSV